MPPPRPHRRHFPRGGRGWRGPSIVYVETVPDVVYCDGTFINGVCIPTNQAGDFWPTFVTPDDAKRYIDEVNAGYQKLDSAVMASTVNADFKTSWTIQNNSWKAFALQAKESVGWFNTRAVMGQTDRYAEELKNWYGGFKTVGGNPPGPPPLPPGQGVPDPNPTKLSDVTTLALVVGGVAALVIFGPKLARVL